MADDDEKPSAGADETAPEETGGRAKRETLAREVRGFSETARIRDRRKLERELTRTQLDIVPFFVTIFGADHFITKYLSRITSKLMKYDVIPEEIPWNEFLENVEEVEEELRGQPVDIEQFIVAHRSLGYGREKENTIDNIKDALNNNEGEIEVDLRLGNDGEVYLVHNSIKDEEKPSGKYTKLRDVLETVANHNFQDTIIFFDIKDEGILDRLDVMIAEIDSKNASKRGFKPLAERHYISSGNENILRRAGERNDNRGLIFSYIPIGILEKGKDLLKKIDVKRFRRIFETLDDLTGTHIAGDFVDTKVKIDGVEIGGSNPQATGVLNLYNELPPDDILDRVEFICIPAPLATEELVRKAHLKHVKVAVWGARGAQIQKAFGLHNVDLVITDEPDIDTGKIIRSGESESEPESESE